MANSARLKVSILDVDPTPWRFFDVPLSMNLTGLHRTIQGAFLWYDSHLWEFEVGEKRYGPLWVDAGDEPVASPDNKRLTFLTKSGVTEFVYRYDFGDGWEHRVEVVDLMDAPSGSRLPSFIDGAVCRPPEDIGGPPGFAHFRDIILDVDHPEHADLLDWYGKPFEQDDIGQDTIEVMMEREAALRPPVK